MFINFYELIEGLDDSIGAREENVTHLKKRRKILEKQTSTEAKSELTLVQNALPIFSYEKRYTEFQLEYVKHCINKSIDSSLYGDNEVSVSEFSEIIKEGAKFGLPEVNIRKYIEEEVAKRGGKILETPEPQKSHKQYTQPPPKRNQPPPNRSQSSNNSSSTRGGLTPITEANVASGIAVSIAVVYFLLFKGGLIQGGWFGLLLFVAAAFVSVKNANKAAKRHGWGIAAVIIMYFINYSMFLLLLPVFAIWHWSPIIFSRFPSKSNLVWLLPVIVCVGVYGSVEAVQRVPRRQSNSIHQPYKSGQVPKQTQAKKGSSESPTQKRTTQNTRVTNKAVNPQKSNPTRQYVHDSLNFELFATSGPLRTGMKISVGDTLVIKVLDETKIEWSESESPVGPKGAPFLARTRFKGLNFLCDDAPPGSVIGRIGKGGQWFLVGNSLTMMASSEGVLYLSINDLADGFDDNFGMFTVQINHAKR